MNPVARMGDTSSHGGSIITGAERTLIEGAPAARVGDLHSCPIPHHGVTRICSGSEIAMVEGKMVTRMREVAGCGAVIVRGADRMLSR